MYELCPPVSDLNNEKNITSSIYFDVSYTWCRGVVGELGFQES